jgi:hypothetical protein
MKNFYLPTLLIMVLLSSCDKGYEARFVNYYNEGMDSVIVGASGAIFTNVAFKQTTDYLPVKQGRHALEFITASKKRFIGVFTVPGTGTGRYTIQIDGIQQISILEEDPQ